MENDNEVKQTNGGGRSRGVSCCGPEAGCACCERKKVRSEEQKALLFNRLSRIEGQLRGIRGMIDRSAYCPDILVQIAAAKAALGSLMRELLAEHVRTCVADDLASGRAEAADELAVLLGRLL